MDRWFDASASVLPSAFTYGNSGGNIIREDSLKVLDFSIFKEFAIHEKSKVQFRAGSFNLNQHTQFSGTERSG